MDEQNNEMDQMNQTENMGETLVEQPVIPDEIVEENTSQMEAQAPAKASFLDKILGFFKGSSN